MGSAAAWGFFGGAYLLGSVLFGLLWARARGIDLREVGSGNVGATNVGRALGPWPGRFVLVLDALKGTLPVALGVAWFGADSWEATLAGIGATLGHCFPLYFGFRGGKGAATGLGSLAPVWPLAAGVALGVFVTTKVLTKKASLGSLLGLVGTLGVVTAEVVAYERPYPPIVMVFVIATLVILRHRANLQRLWNRNEIDA